MEDIEKIKRFLSIGSGYGSGYGSGDGSGYGSGYGSGDGSGYGIKEYMGHTVYIIDNVPTLIYSVVGNYAQAAVICKDLTIKPCFVGKIGNFFAHGETLHEAMQSAQKKYYENKPID